LELVAIKNGITYINDSKATNVDSVNFALQAMEKPTVWIVGGQDKGNDYSPLFKDVKKKVKAIICLGVDNAKLLETFTSFGKPIKEAKSMQEAIEKAEKMAKNGDTILLSPACASFDLFKNYEDRGNQFREKILDFRG
jgi:UDP-N-acetylmuramoylalanine--D-glutamate ligase